MLRLRSLHHRRRTHWVWHLVLALLVVWGQVAAARHSLQHTQRTDADVLHTTCLDCLGLHALDQTGPAVRAAIALPQPAVDSMLAATPRWGVSARPLAAYLSRAPPLLQA